MTTIVSYDEALVELAKLTKSGKYTVKDLMALGSRVSVDVAHCMTQGSVTLLYSGTVNGVGSGTLIADMLKASAGNEIRVIDKTQTGAFLNSPEFKTAFADLKASMTPAEVKAVDDLLYDAKKVLGLKHQKGLQQTLSVRCVFLGRPPISIVNLAQPNCPTFWLRTARLLVLRA